MPYAQQIKRILDSAHHDPFEVLGYHEFENNHSAIRAFFPNASAIEVIFTEDNSQYKMDKIRDEGFFHVNLPFYKRTQYLFRITNFHGHSWYQCDPYWHYPFVTEFDMHLFSEGNHHKMYDFLGAHITESRGVRGVTYAVWAPNAQRVSLVGNFNDWDGRRNMLRNRGTSGIWEIFMPDHCEG
ncbi:MAG: hypothetical protein ACD_79C01021G0001, partial [uncultured bacterium]